MIKELIIGRNRKNLETVFCRKAVIILTRQEKMLLCVNNRIATHKPIQVSCVNLGPFLDSFWFVSANVIILLRCEKSGFNVIRKNGSAHASSPKQTFTQKKCDKWKFLFSSSRRITAVPHCWTYSLCRLLCTYNDLSKL